MVDDLLRRVEEELHLSLSSPSCEEDGELERKLDLARAMAGHGRPSDYAVAISRESMGLLGLIREMESMNRSIQRLLHAHAPTVMAAMGRYIWKRISRKEERPLESYLLEQLGNVHRFNASLDRLISSGREQLDASAREYVEAAKGYGAFHARQEHYREVLERKLALRGEVESAMKDAGRPQRVLYATAAWLLGNQAAELRGQLDRYAAQEREAEESLVAYAAMDARLREHVRLWEDLHAWSEPFEDRLIRLKGMMPQLLAQHRLRKGLQDVMGILSSYTEELRARFEGSMLEMEQDAAVAGALYAGVSGASLGG